KHYIKKSFIKYALSIISLLFVLVLLFLLINVQWIISGPNKKNHIQLSGILDQQLLLYHQGLTDL
ncbi:MAG TPA: sensor histidine kinase, partial [Lachnoclostridium sp.]|nr:sensor histidine kinase [Lachnoclostridium sp.]